MTLDEFTKAGLEILSSISHLKGEVFYSKSSTFKKGKFYLLGLNPGMPKDIEKQRTIEESFKGFSTNQNGDEEYFKTTFGKLEEGIKILFGKEFFNFCSENEKIYEKVFATNLIFKATKGYKDLNFGLAGYCWRLHELAMQVIDPDIIVCIGNGEPNSVYSFIRHFYTDDKDTDNKSEYASIPLDGKFSLKSAKVKILGRERLLLGLPHFSHFTIKEKNTNYEKLRDAFSKLKNLKIL